MAERASHIERDVRAGCYLCHQGEAHWTGPNAQAVAARHHDATGHPTWCDVLMRVRHGQRVSLPTQLEIEALLAEGERDRAALGLP